MPAEGWSLEVAHQFSHFSQHLFLLFLASSFLNNLALGGEKIERDALPQGFVNELCLSAPNKESKEKRGVRGKKGRREEKRGKAATHLHL